MSRDGTTVNILIIEDDLTLLKLYREVLEINGHQVRAAATIQAGQLALQRETYDAYIIDVTIGYLDIWSLVEKYPVIQENAERVVVVSGDKGSLGKAEAHGMKFLLKPATISELLHIIEVCGNEAPAV